MTTPNPNADRYYVAEKPCLRGHCLRFKSSAQCVECARERDRERYSAKVSAQGKSVRAQAPKGSRKNAPIEAPSGAVALLRPRRDLALLLLRDIAAEVDIGGPVFDMNRTVIRHQLSNHQKECTLKLPPLPSAKPTRLNSP